jgi:two-component system, NarL family, response regulator NreC
MKEPISVVLADDHHIVREGIKMLLEAQSDISVIGEASDGLRAVDLTIRLKPLILIVDLMMPGLNGLEVTKQVIQHQSRTKVIILSMYSNEAYVTQALRNGASGYVVKESNVSDMVQAVRDVASGRSYLSPSISWLAMEAYIEKAKSSALDPYDTLTDREKEVFHLITEGFSSAKIAARLYISPRTAESHRSSVMRKLGLKSHTELIKYALRKGLISIE